MAQPPPQLISGIPFSGAGGFDARPPLLGLQIPPRISLPRVAVAARAQTRASSSASSQSESFALCRLAPAPAAPRSKPIRTARVCSPT